MSVNLHRIGTRLFLRDGPDVDPAALVPVFQRWIQRRQLPGLLIDVADYGHLHHGPGVILVGHEGDLSIDFSTGRPAVFYLRKREQAAKLSDGLLGCVRHCLLATELLQREASLPGLQVDLQQTQVVLVDRLRAPNSAESFAALRGELAIFAFRLYGDAHLDHVDQDPRGNLCVNVTAGGENSLSELLGRTAAATVA